MQLICKRKAPLVLFLLLLNFFNSYCRDLSEMQDMFSDIFKDDKSSEKSSQEMEYPAQKRYAIRRRVMKIITTTEEEQIDCRSRGGMPCITNDQCCLGECNQRLGRCPTPAELFESATAELEKKRRKAYKQLRQQQEERQLRTQGELEEQY